MVSHDRKPPGRREAAGRRPILGPAPFPAPPRPAPAHLSLTTTCYAPISCLLVSRRHEAPPRSLQLTELTPSHPWLRPSAGPSTTQRKAPPLLRASSPTLSPK